MELSMATTKFPSPRPDWQISLEVLNDALQVTCPLRVEKQHDGFHVYRVIPPHSEVRGIAHGLDELQLTAWLHGAHTAQNIAHWESTSEVSAPKSELWIR